MQSHEDRDFRPTKSLAEVLGLPRVDENHLHAKAKRMMAEEASQITAGKDGEPIIGEWDVHGVHVVHRPNDESGCLRISVGGGEVNGEPVVYCVFRGDREACAKMLERAARAMYSARAV